MGCLNTHGYYRCMEETHDIDEMCEECRDLTLARIEEWTDYQTSTSQEDDMFNSVIKEDGYSKSVIITGRDSTVSMCSRKTKFATWQIAVRAAESLSALEGRPITPYNCPKCNGIHIGGNNYIKEVELPMKITGRLYMCEYQGLVLMKLKLESVVYIFAVPPTIIEAELKALEVGILIAYKMPGGVYRGRSGEKDPHYREYNNLITMHIKDKAHCKPLLDAHCDNMMEFEDVRNLVINNGEFRTIEERAGLNKPVVPEPDNDPFKRTVLADTNTSEQEMFGGRAVFRTEGGRPYHRDYATCCHCKTIKIELRSYITRREDTGKLNAVLAPVPADKGVLERGSRKKKEFMCANCANNKAGFKPAAVVEEDVEKQKVEFTHVEEKVETPAVAVTKRGYETDSFNKTVLLRLQNMCLDSNVDPETKVGAAYMATLLILGEGGEA